MCRKGIGERPVRPDVGRDIFPVDGGVYLSAFGQHDTLRIRPVHGELDFEDEIVLMIDDVHPGERMGALAAARRIDGHLRAVDLKRMPGAVDDRVRRGIIVVAAVGRKHLRLPALNVAGLRLLCRDDLIDIINGRRDLCKLCSVDHFVSSVVSGLLLCGSTACGCAKQQNRRTDTRQKFFHADLLSFVLLSEPGTDPGSRCVLSINRASSRL